MQDRVRSHLQRRKRAPLEMSSHEAAALVGVSRPFMAACIATGEVSLLREHGNESVVLVSDVRKWHRRYKAWCRGAMIELANGNHALDAISDLTQALSGQFVTEDELNAALVDRQLPAKS